MIIKSLSRKKPSFFQLYDYMIDGADEKEKVISKNLYQTDSRHEVLKQFTKNHNLLPERKNGNAMYHEILSLPHQKNISLARQKEILCLLANQYLEDRVQLNLAFGVIHEEKDHLHCHLMISSNEKNSNKRQRLSKTHFAQLQKDLESYKHERFPELEDRVLYNKERTKNRYQSSQSKDRENQLKHRSGEPSRNEQIQQRVSEAITLSYSLQQLKTKLKQDNLELYTRGNTAGIIDLEAKEQGKQKHKYRLKRLELDEQYQNLLAFEKAKEQRQEQSREARSKQRSSQSQDRGGLER